MYSISGQTSAVISALAAAFSALFAGVAWWSWRSQFRMSFPYIEAYAQRAQNCIFVYWSKDGPNEQDWEIDWVKLSGSVGQFAKYQSIAHPDTGKSWVGKTTMLGFKAESPQHPLCIVDSDQMTEIKLSFRLRSKSHGRLSQTRKLKLIVR